MPSEISPSSSSSSSRQIGLPPARASLPTAFRSVGKLQFSVLISSSSSSLFECKGRCASFNVSNQLSELLIACGWHRCRCYLTTIDVWGWNVHCLTLHAWSPQSQVAVQSQQVGFICRLLPPPCCLLPACNDEINCPRAAICFWR